MNPENTDKTYVHVDDLKLKPTGKFGIPSVRHITRNLTSVKKKLNFEKVSSVSILKISKEFKTNKATGVDNLTGRFLKDGSNILCTPKAKIYNLSITLASFPEKCKIAKIKPFYKKGLKTDPKNFSPISLLPLVSKIIERIIHDQTMNFLSYNNVLYKYQSGFRKFHSTDTCLSYLYDKITKGFDSGILTGMVLIDLQKVFDTIDHYLFIKKCLIWVLLMRQSSGIHHISQIGSLLSVWKMQIRIKHQ